MEQPREVEPVGLPMVDRLALIEHLTMADHLGEGPEAERGHVFAHFFGYEEEIVDDMLRLALEARAQDRVLRGDADRAGVEMALAHHDATGGDQSAVAKPNSSAPRRAPTKTSRPVRMPPST